MRLCVVEYAFSTATYRSALTAQYLLRKQINPFIFSDFYHGKMSMNTINSIAKRITAYCDFYSGICYMIKHSEINSDS